MKRLLVLSIPMLFLLSASDKDRYEIKGKIEPAFNGCSVILYPYDEDADSERAQTCIIKNGTFKFAGTASPGEFYYLTTEVDDTYSYAVVAAEAGTIYLDMTFEDYKVSGTPLNDLWQSFRDGDERHGPDAITKFVINNISNPVGIHAFKSNYQLFSEQELAAILEAGGDDFRNAPTIDLYIRGNRAIRKIQRENLQREETLNVKYVDFELVTPDGEIKRISDYVGKSKYLMIDFWASWCRPCIAGMPHMKMLYEKYRDEGFEIIGISVDEEKSRDLWLNMLQNIDTPWPQLAYLHGFSSDLSKAYIISDIPYVVIIDDRGAIVRYVRMPALSLEDHIRSLIE